MAVSITGLKSFIFLFARDYVEVSTDLDLTQDNLSLYYELEDDSGNQIYKGFAVFNDSGVAKIRYNDICNVKPHLPPASSIFPSPAAPDNAEATQAFNQYRFKLAESYGDPPAVQPTINSDYFTCIYGGLPADAFNANYLDDGSIIKVLHPDLKWKQTEGFKKPIRPNQPDYMYFWSRNDQLLSFVVEATYDDGTVETTPVDTVSCEEGKVYWMTAGPRNLNILSPTAVLDPEPKLVSYRLYEAESGAGREYILDHSCRLDEIFLLFDNGLGALESIAMVGEYRMGGRTEKDTFRRAIWDGIDPVTEGEVVPYKVRAQDTLRLNSGYIPIHYAQFLRQMICGRIWWIRYFNNEEDQFQAYEVQENEIEFKPQGDLAFIELNLRSSFFSPNLITV